MNVIDIKDLPKTVLPKHHDVYAQEIRGPLTGSQRVSVLYNEMKAHGGAEMHVHPDSEHVFVVLEGELQVDDGKERCVIRKGMALVVEPGEPHQVTGAGACDCVYLLITCPPATVTP